VITAKASDYISKRLFGGTGVDQSDSDEDEQAKVSQSMFDVSPNTQRRKIDLKKAD
jgi:proton-coupled amino acid transporter